MGEIFATLDDLGLAESQPELTRELFIQLNDWIDDNVAVKYMPELNPEYDPGKEVRDQPFKDLRRKYLGEERAIRKPGGDPRFDVLRKLAGESENHLAASSHCLSRTRLSRSIC